MEQTLREIIEWERPVRAVDRQLMADEYASLYQDGFRLESVQNDERGNGSLVMKKVVLY